MFQINDIVIHPTAGVCKVKDIRHERFEKQAQNYYLLVPVGEKIETRIFVPVSSDRIKLRRPLQKAQIDTLLLNAGAAPALWYKDDKEREEKFDAILKSGNHAAILNVIGALLSESHRRTAENKKLRTADARLLTRAQEMIDREFSHVLGLDRTATVNYIVQTIQKGSA
ncbi:MAG: CarD family transcriptional regulator [Clostridia bacterium]|nr:CarD family transcriptional regulator [Clostridia bacterium]